MSASRAIVILEPRSGPPYAEAPSTRSMVTLTTMSSPTYKSLNDLMRHTRSSAGIDERVAILQDLERPACRHQRVVD